MKTTLDEESYGMFAKIMRTFHKDSNFDVMLSKLTTLFPVTDTSFRNAFLGEYFAKFSVSLSRNAKLTAGFCLQFF